jgi:hypothetical protein
MIPHQNPAMQHPPLRHAALIEALDEALPRSGGLEYERAVVPAIDHMIDRSRIFNSNSTRRIIDTFSPKHRLCKKKHETLGGAIHSSVSWEVAETETKTTDKMKR